MNRTRTPEGVSRRNLRDVYWFLMRFAFYREFFAINHSCHFNVEMNEAKMDELIKTLNLLKEKHGILVCFRNNDTVYVYTPEELANEIAMIAEHRNCGVDLYSDSFMPWDDYCIYYADSYFYNGYLNNMREFSIDRRKHKKHNTYNPKKKNDPSDIYCAPNCLPHGNNSRRLKKNKARINNKRTIMKDLDYDY